MYNNLDYVLLNIIKYYSVLILISFHAFFKLNLYANQSTKKITYAYRSTKK